MERRLKILAIHGLWEKGSVFNALERRFREHIFFAPNMIWELKHSARLLNILIKDWQPDIIIGYSYGAYAVQGIFEANTRAAQLCVLIAPPGPKGMSVKSFMRAIRKRFYAENRRSDHVKEKLKTVAKIFPFAGKVSRPIEVPALVISGERDDLVSYEDARKTAEFHSATHYHFPVLSHKELVSSVNVAENIKLWIECKA